MKQKSTFNTPAPTQDHRRAKRTTSGNHQRSTEPTTAAFVPPPVGRRVLRRNRNTHKHMPTHLSADRRPPAALIAALSSVVR